MMAALRVLLIWLLPCIALFAGIAAGVRSGQWRLIASWYVKSTVLFMLGLPVTVLGVVMVAVAIPFRVRAGDAIAFTQYPDRGRWQLERLPVWARPWDNAFDGLLGDKRGWFANWCYGLGIAAPSFWSRWIWAALRNPANYWSRNLTGCDVTGCRVETLFGPDVVDEDNPGFHMLVAIDTQGRHYPTIDFAIPWPFAKAHGFTGRFGWKVKKAHAGTPADARPQDRIKGSVYRAALWQSFGG